MPTLSQVIEHRGIADFTYYGEDMHVEFNVDHVTREFRVEALRLQREMNRLSRRQDEATKRIIVVVAPDGTPEAKAEDEEAERLLQQLVADDAHFKEQLDAAICYCVKEWNVTDEKGVMIPLDPKILNPIPPSMLARVLGEVLKAANMGEASVPPSPSGSKSTSKRTGLVSMKKGSSSRRRSG